MRIDRQDELDDMHREQEQKITENAKQGARLPYLSNSVHLPCSTGGHRSYRGGELVGPRGGLLARPPAVPFLASVRFGRGGSSLHSLRRIAWHVAHAK